MPDRTEPWSGPLYLEFTDECMIRGLLIDVAQRSLAAYQALKSSCSAEVFDPPDSLEQAAEHAQTLRNELKNIKYQMELIDDFMRSPRTPDEGDADA